MEVTPEMIDAYIQDQLPWMDNTDRVRILQGIAIYTYLQSPSSDDWRNEHGFLNNDDTKHLLGTTDMCSEEYINW